MSKKSNCLLSFMFLMIIAAVMAINVPLAKRFVKDIEYTNCIDQLKITLDTADEKQDALKCDGFYNLINTKLTN